MMKIALIHALAQSVAPVNVAFAKHWPEARLMNLLDDSLSMDVAREGHLTEDITRRFIDLGRYARSTGVDGILFTCSAFGSCIEACARDLAPLPVLKPNEGMVDEAIKMSNKIGLISTFAPTLRSMPDEFRKISNQVQLETALVESALEALSRGDTKSHDKLITEAALAMKDVEVIALAQFSLSRAAPLVAAATGKPVLTTIDSALARLRGLLEPDWHPAMPNYAKSEAH